MPETALRVEGLTVYRETYAALQNVSFSLEAGTDTAIIGPNGAGKSTLIQAILGILPRQGGRVEILGHSLSSRGYLPPRIRQAIAYLPQNFRFDRRIPITVGELVGLGWDGLGLQLPWQEKHKRRQAVRAALARVGATHLGDRRIGDLSGGETKRMLLAYCVVRPRCLLVLDEAVAGLDASGESEFYRLLYQLKEEQGWTIVQISHDLEMVSKNCDRVLCLNRTLLCQGTPEIALSPDNLLVAYGSEFVRYRHSCYGSY